MKREQGPKLYLVALSPFSTCDYASVNMQIADAPVRKMVMLGNHDAWNCLTRGEAWSADLKNGPAKNVVAQLDMLGDMNLAWNCKPIDGKHVTIIGGRPFSAVHVPTHCSYAQSMEAASRLSPWQRLRIHSGALVVST